MQPNAFLGAPRPPTDPELTAALGPARDLWDRLLAALATAGAPDREWKSSSPNSGWSLRVKRRDRNIVYLSPAAGGTASLALGDRAMAMAREAGFPAPVTAILDAARRYAEGTGVRIPVRAAEDVEIVTRLAEIKLRS